MAKSNTICFILIKTMNALKYKRIYHYLLESKLTLGLKRG
jgi:hypothetical protein